MTEPEIDRIIQTYAEVARPTMLAAFGPIACIACSRCTIECLARFGINDGAGLNTRLTVYARSLNAAYISGWSDEERANVIRDKSATLIRDHRIDWSERGHNGHVVAIAGGWFIDSSFDQVVLPDPRVSLDPYVFAHKIPPGVTNPELQAELVTNGGITLEIHYAPLPPDDFTSAPAWSYDAGERLVVTLIEHKVRERLRQSRHT